MRFIFSRTFWGLVLVFIGVSLIAENVFHLEIPVFAIIISLILISIGVSIILNSSGVKRKVSNAIFEDAHINVNEKKDEYNVIFGKGEIDLTKIKIFDRTIRINVIFGSGTLIFDKSQPIKIHYSSVFANVIKLPENKATSFGAAKYQSKSFKEKGKKLIIEASVVFGELKIIEK